MSYMFYGSHSFNQPETAAFYRSFTTFKPIYAEKSRRRHSWTDKISKQPLRTDTIFQGFAALNLTAPATPNGSRHPPRPAAHGRGTPCCCRTETAVERTSEIREAPWRQTT